MPLGEENRRINVFPGSKLRIGSGPALGPVEGKKTSEGSQVHNV